MLEPIGSVLPKVLQRRGLFQAAHAGSVVTAAQAWITSALPDHASALRAVRAKEGTLFIAAANPIALTECSQKQADLLQALATSHPKAVARIRISRETSAKNA